MHFSSFVKKLGSIAAVSTLAKTLLVLILRKYSHISSFDKLFAERCDKTGNLIDSNIYDLVKNIGKPGDTCKFPIYDKYGKYRAFTLPCLPTLPWLTYSGTLVVRMPLSVLHVFFGSSIRTNARRSNKSMKSSFMDRSTAL